MSDINKEQALFKEQGNPNATTRNLVRRVEEASLNAWPAMHQVLADGWLVRMSNGFTKRANCVVPLYAGSESSSVGEASQVLEKIRYCENLYAREQLKTIFRLTSIPNDPALDELLARRGYQQLDLTDVKIRNLTTLSQPNQAVAFRLLTLAEWVEHYAVLSDMPTHASRLHATLIRAIRPDCAFGVLEHNDDVVACGLGVKEQDMVGIFDVITAAKARREGYGRALMQGLLGWGATQGAHLAYLQVAAGNSPAVSLYEGLGFRNLYHYWYRQTP